MCASRVGARPPWIACCFDTPQGLEPLGCWRPAGTRSGASPRTRTETPVRHGPARPRATCPYCPAAGWSMEHPMKRLPTPHARLGEETALD
jgi:hypothetical protein